MSRQTSAARDRRARKRARKAENRARRPPVCDGCGMEAPRNDGDHDTAWSANAVTFDGVAVVAFCRYCGCDTCADRA